MQARRVCGYILDAIPLVLSLQEKNASIKCELQAKAFLIFELQLSSIIVQTIS